MPRRWTNDYGDIPRWYWGPVFRRPRPARSRVAGALLSMVLACG